MQHRVSMIKTIVESAAGDFLRENIQKLEAEKLRLQSLSEWSLLGTDEKARLGAELDALIVEATCDLNGIKKLINDGYYFASVIDRIEAEIKTLAGDGGGGGGDGPDFFDVVLEVPRLVTTADGLDDLIQKLQDLKIQLQEGSAIKITWR